ncbi:MAG TPA: FAD-binding and (Fe-S)-binding domain-containing protein [Candidatus Polarisedimenticolaceae bacterium]
MELRLSLEALLAPDRVLTRPLDLAVYATDASLYRIPPSAVVRPKDVEEIRGLFAFARRQKIPLTFRAAGTSLSGQALGTGIVVDVSRHWRRLDVLDDGRRIRVAPGVIGGFANRALARYGTKLGPDPASIDACMIGGIVANNSSGMCCGIERNAYRTLESLQFVLPSGSVVDSGLPHAGERLRESEPAIWNGLARLRDRVRGDAPLAAKIARKYRLKNTMGYQLNAFVDFHDPLDILWHLVVGSEGTLAFVAEATFRTVPDLPHKATGLQFYETVHAACRAIEPLRESGAAALELMDRASLRAVEGRPGVPASVSQLGNDAAAILVEYQAADAAELDSVSASLTRDAAEQGALWTVRKGIIPSVGARRRRGTTLVTEDVVFPPEHLADGVLGLQELFRKHRYEDAVVFGHAKDGNLHFLLAQGMDADGARQLESFTADLADLVIVRHAGALKAEHGTGRNMAPFVETEWGADAYAVMREVKRLIDPDGILNPGVLLNDDRRVHVSSLKTLPPIEEEADACIECGFCEPRCPSRDLTLSPRHRILVRRERARLLEDGLEDQAVALESESAYDVLDTCATDGLCATACPVAIDTGKLVKRLRAEGHGPIARTTAAALASGFRVVEPAARMALRLGRSAASTFGDAAISGATSALGFPEWLPDSPPPAPPLPRTTREGAAAVYVPSCVSRIAGDGEQESLAATIVAVAARAGIAVWIPGDVAGSCCGMPFASKGFPREAAALERASHARIDRWTQGGKLPAFTDTSPCAHQWGGSVLDGIAFAHDVVLPRLPIRRRLPSVALHAVCSAQKLGLDAKFRAIASACARNVFVPPSAGCCGFAGDRGYLHPELTASATAEEARELAHREFDGYYATSRTCEIGLERATGWPWRSIWRLLDAASR